MHATPRRWEGREMNKTMKREEEGELPWDAKRKRAKRVPPDLGVALFLLPLPPRLYYSALSSLS